MSIRIRFEPRDLWIGAYVGPTEFGLGKRGQFRRRSLYLCIVPMLPFIFTRTEWR